MTVTVTGGGHVGHVGQTDDIGGGMVGMGVVLADALGDGVTDPGMLLGIDTVLEMTTFVEDEEMMFGTVVWYTIWLVGSVGVLESITTVEDDEITVGTVTGTTDGLVVGLGVLEIGTTIGEETVVGMVTGMIGVLTVTEVLEMTTSVGVDEIVVGVVTGTITGVVCKEVVLKVMTGVVLFFTVSVLVKTIWV